MSVCASGAGVGALLLCSFDYSPSLHSCPSPESITKRSFNCSSHFKASILLRGSHSLVVIVSFSLTPHSHASRSLPHCHSHLSHCHSCMVKWIFGPFLILVLLYISGDCRKFLRGGWG